MSRSTRNQNLELPEDVAESINDWARRSCCSFEEALQVAISTGLEHLEARLEKQNGHFPNGCADGLPAKQKQVLGFLKAGYSVKEIAGEMGVSETTGHPITPGPDRLGFPRRG